MRLTQLATCIMILQKGMGILADKMQRPTTFTLQFNVTEGGTLLKHIHHSTVTKEEKNIRRITDDVLEIELEENHIAITSYQKQHTRFDGVQLESSNYLGVHNIILRTPHP